MWTTSDTDRACTAAQDAFGLDRALFDTAMQNIAQRASQRRREAILDGVLLACLAFSSAFLVVFAIMCYLVVNGRL
jgi:hypothetical protein